MARALGLLKVDVAFFCPYCGSGINGSIPCDAKRPPVLVVPDVPVRCHGCRKEITVCALLEVRGKRQPWTLDWGELWVSAFERMRPGGKGSR